MEKIKVLLSDPQVLFREGIHFILSGEEDFEVTGETTSNDEAFNLIQANPPTIAIISTHDIKADGIAMTRRIRRTLLSVYVILIIDTKDPEKIFLAIKNGASAYITKDTEPEQLLDIIRVVAQGNLPILDELFTPALAKLVVSEFEEITAMNEDFADLLAKLAPKELEVLNNIAAGSNVAQAVIKLDMNEESIRRNMRLVLNKLVANDQARTVIEATQQRSIPAILRTSKRDIKSADYVSRAEFNEFKDHLMERLKSLIV